MLSQELNMKILEQLADIKMCQTFLARLDSQKYIYEQSGVATIAFKDHLELRSFCINNMLPDGEVLEFGVYKGESINFFAKKMRLNGDQRKITGFDSFVGFSEEWSGVNKKYPRERFDLKGKLPEVDSNVVLVSGFVEETLPKYILEREVEFVSFVHIDTDTYTPAKTVLSTLRPLFRPGTIILFDELCGYPNWRNHEYKALSEVLKQNEFEFLGFAQAHSKATLIKAAIRIL